MKVCHFCSKVNQLRRSVAISIVFILENDKYQIVEGVTIREHIKLLASQSMCQVYGYPCDDGDACTSNDRCDGMGFCVDQNATHLGEDMMPKAGNQSPIVDVDTGLNSDNTTRAKIQNSGCSSQSNPSNEMNILSLFLIIFGLRTIIYSKNIAKF